MSNKKKASLTSLMIGAIGIVYGDIGTSPLYALKSCFSIGNLAVSEMNVLGLISIFIWSLFLIVTIKYILLVMRIDNQGEGGILVLSTICEKLSLGRYTVVPMVLGIVGAALIFGDGVITPAISVLGALEGLELISPVFSHYILILAFFILSFLFYIQKNGSGLIGAYFGPVMMVWFATIGALGISSIMESPAILMAFNPYYALHFFWDNGLVALMTLGGVILVVTGAEAIYADMGHFGRKPISLTWTVFVFPALVLNYLGQGALLLTTPDAIANPFYHIVPEIALYPMIILSTVATIIASQSILSGVFSLAWQAIMLNYLPRLTVLHTSSKQIGQVYVPAINTILYVLTIAAILTFRTSDNLAVAYGLSVAGCMLITTCLVLLIASEKWHWPRWALAGLFVPLVLIDTTFVATNVVKLFEGAWYTVLITAIATYIIYVWMKGSKALEEQKIVPHKNLKSYVMEYQEEHPTRIPGTAVFMSRTPNKIPNSLMIHLHHNKFLHKKLVFVSIVTKNTPKSNGDCKYSSTKLMKDTYVINANFGFMEVPSLRKVMNWAKEQKIIKPDEEVSFILSKGVPVVSNNPMLSGLGEKLYIFLSKNSLSAYEFYNIPNHSVIELGVRYRV